MVRVLLLVGRVFYLAKIISLIRTLVPVKKDLQTLIFRFKYMKKDQNSPLKRQKGPNWPILIVSESRI
jgi:hypothetical protein